MPRRVILLLLAAIVPVLAGCGSSGSSSAPTAVSTTSAGWKEYRPTGGGYSVELPPDWQAVDAGAIADAGGLDQFAQQHPELSNMSARFAAIAHTPGTLLGVDRSAAGIALVQRTSLAANILVHITALQTSVGDAQLLEQVMAGARQSVANLPGGGAPSQEGRLTMAGAPGLSISYHITVPTAAGSFEATELDSFTVKDGVVFVVSCTSTVDDFDRIKPACDHALASFAVTG